MQAQRTKRGLMDKGQAGFGDILPPDASAKKPRFIDVYQLKTVYNVCNQNLREVISLPKVSLAHVTMDPGDNSLWHRHHRMYEIYFVLSGKGILYHGDMSTVAEKGTYVMIPPWAPHKLDNRGRSELEHLVLAMPPFDRNDIKRLKGSANAKARPERFRHGKPPVTALDGALVYELGTQAERNLLDVGLAVGFLQKGRKAKPHHHCISEEIYYVVRGRGKVMAGSRKFDVKKGSVVFIPRNVVHALENGSETDELELLCISSPAYREGDFIRE